MKKKVVKKKLVKKKVKKRHDDAPTTPTKKKTVKKKSSSKGKKLTKAEEHRQAHALRNLRGTVSSYLEATLDEIRGETGDLTVSTMKDAGRMIVGIPWPSFCLEYATCNTVCPLEKYLQVYGPTGIGKSGITFEIMRWFAKLYGIGHYLEHETKFNGDWASSIMGWEYADLLGVIQCDSPEDWQKHLLGGFKKIQRIMTGDKKQRGAGRIFPYLAIVDSLMAKLLKESQTKIETQGYAGRGFPVEALSITRFLQATAHKMRGWPFMVVTVNHMKTAKDDAGKTTKSRAGGQHVNFQGSFEIEINRIKSIKTAKYDGNRLVLQVQKNSYGPDKRKIIVDCVWWDEEYDAATEGPVTDATTETGLRQKTIWDWHGATVRLLFDLDGAVATDARKFCGLVKDTETLCHSNKLGIPKSAPDHKRQYHYVGAKIMQNREMVKYLRDAFGVRTRKRFQPGIEYTKQVLSEKQLALREENHDG